MKIVLPWPDRALNPNQSKGRHWGKTSGLRAMARSAAWALTREAMGTRGYVVDGLALTITFVQPDRRARDRDNLLAALKPSLDGIADALGVDDSEFEPVTLRREYGTKPGCVVVELA